MPRGWSNTATGFLESWVVDVTSLSVFKKHLENTFNKVFYLLVRPEVVSQLNEIFLLGPLQIDILSSKYVKTGYKGYF